MVEYWNNGRMGKSVCHDQSHTLKHILLIAPPSFQSSNIPIFPFALCSVRYASFYYLLRLVTYSVNRPGSVI